MKLLKISSVLYFFALVALFIYSFTQVDLSLTLSQNSIFQSIEKNLQYVGFYQRQISAYLFSILAVIFLGFYFLFLKLAKKGILKVKTTLILAVITFIILVFSYNAFSYDLFNYIFDAKIISYYHLNPYMFKALDFASDPMLSFMRWTHRLYPYGPSWLALTVPLSFIGSNFFILTFLLFKFMIGSTYLGSVYLIYKISDFLFPKDKIFNTVFFAFNPLVIIEGLVSAHNDFPLVFFALLSLYLYLNKKKFLSIISLIFSIGIKYFSIILFPIFFIKKDFEKLFLVLLGISLFGVIYAAFRTTFQPWYLIFPLSIASFISKKSLVLIPSIVMSITCLFVYAAYVLMTDYSSNYPQTIFTIETIGFCIALISFLLIILKNRFAS